MVNHTQCLRISWYLKLQIHYIKRITEGKIRLYYWAKISCRIAEWRWLLIRSWGNRKRHNIQFWTINWKKERNLTTQRWIFSFLRITNQINSMITPLLNPKMKKILMSKMPYQSKITSTFFFKFTVTKCFEIFVNRLVLTSFFNVPFWPVHWCTVYIYFYYAILAG